MTRTILLALACTLAISAHARAPSGVSGIFGAEEAINERDPFWAERPMRHTLLSIDWATIQPTAPNERKSLETLCAAMKIGDEIPADEIEQE